MSPRAFLLCLVQSSMAGEPPKRGNICLILCAAGRLDAGRVFPPPSPRLLLVG